MTQPALFSPHAWRLDRVALNVGDLALATRFYCEALGFTPIDAAASDTALAGVLGVERVRVARLRRGRQMLELAECDPSGAPIAPGGRSDDLDFQHCALVTADMVDAYARLRRFAIAPVSRDGPVTLPGGIVAFKFRDPDGHPLELIAFPAPDPATAGGIDHSAICVSDPAASIAFYAAHAGLAETVRQTNRGPAQAALDDLDSPVVEVVALAPAIPAPHVELLCYRHPRPRATPHPGDRLASRLVFARLPVAETRQSSQGNGGLTLLHDPDGHAVLLDRRTPPLPMKDASP